MNFQEAQIHALIVRSHAIATEVIAMQTNDACVKQSGHGGEYTEQAYIDMAQQLHSIHDEIQAIARAGYL